MNRLLLLLIVTISLITGCGKEEVTPSESAKEDFIKAKEYIDTGSYTSANLFLEKFSNKHPYSQHIAEAEILRIYAAFKGEEYILSETLSTRFISKHPNHPDTSYAQYMLGMSHLKQTSASQRDPAPTRLAVTAFEKLIQKYPKSSYISEAKVHLQNLHNKLAEHELYIGKFYFNNKRFVASTNRFQDIVKQYQTSPVIEEALYYLAASFNALQLKDSARDSAILLRHNYPKSEWSEKAANFL
ncbi:MAG: outer membrane protein assembly factor BamD [Mariprofundaceae bacterium]|nr:outer membrane protein assembly factor BamD [Mariprofundaceae bacterium]